MVRRTKPRRQVEEHAFPVRVIVNLPNREVLRLTRAENWLMENVGKGNFASHQAPHWADARAFYFRSTDDAKRLTDAMPDFELLDMTHMVEHLRNAQENAGKPKVPMAHHTTGPGPLSGQPSPYFEVVDLPKSQL